MKRVEMTKILEKLKMAYPEKFNLNEDTVGAWYEFIGDIDYETASQAVHRYVRESEYAPTVAGIMKRYNEIVEENIKRKMDAINEFDAATSIYPGVTNDDSKEFYRLLSGYPVNKWGVIQGRFRRSIWAYIEKCEKERRSPKQMNEVIKVFFEKL